MNEQTAKKWHFEESKENEVAGIFYGYFPMANSQKYVKVKIDFS